MASKPGERRHQILQTLAAMLENPRAESVSRDEYEKALRGGAGE